MIKLTSARSPFLLLPNKIPIGTEWYTIVFDECDDEDNIAEIDFDEHTITVDPTKDARRQWVSFWHEVGHGMMTNYDMTMTTPKSECTAASIIGNCIASIIKCLYQDWKRTHKMVRKRKEAT